jgi:hypothetical protein
MPQPTCHHVHANGELCQSPPLRKRDYCHFHLDQIGRQLRAARNRARHQPARLKLPLLEDPFAVQVAVMQVADALAYNEIDVPRGRALLSLLRLASSNLKTARAWDHEPLFAPNEDSASVTDWPDFEQQNQLPPRFDLSIDPEAAFPAPASPASEADSKENDPLRHRVRKALGNAATTVPGTSYKVTGEDMELIDIYEREGRQAAEKYALHIERNRRRQERRLRRQHFEELAHNRNIQLAAEKLRFEEQAKQKAPADSASAAPDPLESYRRKAPKPQPDVPQAASVGAP